MALWLSSYIVFYPPNRIYHYEQPLSDFSISVPCPLKPASGIVAKYQFVLRAIFRWFRCKEMDSCLWMELAGGLENSGQTTCSPADEVCI